MYDGREILTCGRDGEPEPMQKLQDLVNRYVTIMLLRIKVLLLLTWNIT